MKLLFLRQRLWDAGDWSKAGYEIIYKGVIKVMGRAQEKLSLSGICSSCMFLIPQFLCLGTKAVESQLGNLYLQEELWLREGPSTRFWHKKIIMYEDSGLLNKQKVQNLYSGEYCCRYQSQRNCSLLG